MPIFSSVPPLKKGVGVKGKTSPESMKLNR